MRHVPLALTALALTALVTPSPARSAAPACAALHCQIPCGIYGDRMRIDMLMEDAATIEKGMNMLNAPEAPSQNQAVRWVMNKDTHAEAIQNQVAAYWLAQRVKAPKDARDEAAKEHYHKQLELMHGITVAAMKCKQTTDIAHVAKLRSLAVEFARTYFSGEDLEHIQDHHGSHAESQPTPR